MSCLALLSRNAWVGQQQQLSISNSSKKNCVRIAFHQKNSYQNWCCECRTPDFAILPSLSIDSKSRESLLSLGCLVVCSVVSCHADDSSYITLVFEDDDWWWMIDFSGLSLEALKKSHPESTKKCQPESANKFKPKSANCTLNQGVWHWLPWPWFF